MENIESEIEKIESILKKYDSISIVKYLAFWLTRIGERNSHPFFSGLKSPYKQLHYVASLALKQRSTGEKKLSDDDWKAISMLLQKIEDLYNSAVTKDFQDIDQEVLKKTGVSQATYLNYFFNGTFAFKEQLIDRIESTFNKYDTIITNETGLSVKDFIEVLELIIDECNIKLNFPLDIQNSGDWIQFTDEMDRLSIPPEEWKMYFTDELNAAFETLTQPESILLIDTENLHVNCDKAKLLTFLGFLSVPDLYPNNIIYYGEKLPLELNPFVKISDTEYLIFYQNEVLSAIYDKLVSICSQQVGAKFFKYRDSQTELKVLEIFGLLFNEKKAKIFFNYSIDGHAEQDILIVHGSTAFIIEVKAASFREPMREPIKAFEKIKSDFKKNIQEAYKQCLRVEDAFELNDSINIFDKKGKLIDTIKADTIECTYSIIVTLDRFGLIQSDLAHLLEIEDDLPYPWSVNIDDLETFLLMLKKQKKAQQKFVKFLSNRELLHGRLHAMDEIDVCCWYLRNEPDFINGCNESQAYILANPQESQMVDKAYFSKGGLGFKNERNLDLKNSGKALFLGKPE